MSFTDFSGGNSHSFGGTCLELVPHQRLRYTAVYDDPNLPGAMRDTITFTKVSCGTGIQIVQERIPAAIPIEACQGSCRRVFLRRSRLNLEAAVDRFLPLGTRYQLQLSCSRARSPHG